MATPSITDWTQAIAITIGVGFALWEFVLQDRNDERLAKESVLRLIEAGQSETVYKGYNKILSGVLEFHNEDAISSVRWTTFKVEIRPYTSHIEAWAFCYSNNLCNKKITLKYICPKVTSYERLMAQLASKSGNNIDVNSADYHKLVNDCGKNTKLK